MVARQSEIASLRDLIEVRFSDLAIANTQRWADLNARLDERYLATQRDIDQREKAASEASLRLGERIDGLEALTNTVVSAQRHARVWDGAAAAVGAAVGFLTRRI